MKKIKIPHLWYFLFLGILIAMETPTLKEIDDFTVPEFLAERVAILHDLPIDFATGLVREAKRMLYLSIISNDSVAPSDRVDLAWHEMILFTRFYKEYADYIGGFIHHIPERTEKNEKTETWKEIQKTLGKERRGSDTYNKTKANYLKYFGIAPDPLYWP